MFDTNFWGLFIGGLTDVLQQVVAPLPPSLVNPILATGATIAFYGVAPVLFFVGPFINLNLFVTVISAIVALEIVRGVIALWRLVLKLVPMAG